MLHLLAAYKKPVLLIAVLNVATVAAITISMRAEPYRDSVRTGSYAQRAPRCSQAAFGDLPTQTALELKTRAARVFKAERANPTVEGSFLMALSMSLGFHQYGRVEALLNQYECGHTL